MPDRTIHALGMRHLAHVAKNAEGRCRRTPADPVKNGHAQGVEYIQRWGICEQGTGPTTDVTHGSGHRPLPRRNGRVTRINGLGRTAVASRMPSTASPPGASCSSSENSVGSYKTMARTRRGGRPGQPSAPLPRPRNGRPGQTGHPPWQTPSRAASPHRPVTPPGSPARPAPFPHPADRAPAHGTAATAGSSGCATAPRCLPSNEGRRRGGQFPLPASRKKRIWCGVGTSIARA